MIKHIAQICLNGHIMCPSIIRFPELLKKFCTKCGAKTITECPNCNAQIYENSIEISEGEDIGPAFCHDCGKPYPWTIKREEAAQEWLKELDGIPEEDRKIIEENLSDIINTTPMTGLASKRVEKLLKKFADSPIAKAIRQFIIDFGTEQVKRSLYP